MRWMGLDLGSKRIGVALSDELGLTAQPLQVIARHGGTRDLEALARLVREHAVTGVVAGLPLNMDGSEGEAAARVRRFTENLSKHLGLPVRLWDERLTTWEAEAVLREAGVRSRKGRQVVDKLAAALILKGFLDATRAEAVEGKA
jgi:putative Holliday junction resolvase